MKKTANVKITLEGTEQLIKSILQYFEQASPFTIWYESLSLEEIINDLVIHDLDAKYKKIDVWIYKEIELEKVTE